MKRIPAEWHKNTEFEDLTNEEWADFRLHHYIGNTLYIDDNECECETFVIDGSHRCKCGNRRCYVVADSFDGRRFFRVEV